MVINIDLSLKCLQKSHQINIRILDAIFLAINFYYVKKKPYCMLTTRCPFIYLSYVCCTSCMINFCFIKRVMLYQILPVRTFFNTSPSFNASVTYFRRFFSIFHITKFTTKIALKWFLSKI